MPKKKKLSKKQKRATRKFGKAVKLAKKMRKKQPKAKWQNLVSKAYDKM